ncbi:MAG: PEP-utilizing enzyme [Patescibacteria group bacterium]
MLDNKEVNETVTKWKRINMRNVDDLLGVEFIHDLYNRHEPKINSIRFRHTITVWKDGIVNSYAPVDEWERLGELLGYQYYALNTFIVEQTKNLYHRKREHFHEFMRQLEKTEFATLLNDDLAALLINFQSIVLGELYVLNFVQIEHGLNTAVKQIINEINSDKSGAENIFVQLIQTEIPTASQKERRKLYLLAQKWRLLKKISLYKKDKAEKDVRRHSEKYGHLYSAYGESPRSFEDFWTTFQDYLQNKQSPPKKILFPKLLTHGAKKILKELGNEKLNVLIPLLVQGGVFRDTNKALLGLSIKYRFLVLDEIARRGIETRDNLKWYLLSEITALLRDSKKLSMDEIETRKNNGVVVTRYEDFRVYTEGMLPVAERKEGKKILRGQCASPGICIGECKIVFTKEDADKVQQGDIMVAIGTDFDLIEAMYRSAAVVTEEGGILSHASVVCRELNKPCCIGVKDATRLLQDNQKVRVNATQGEILLLE